MYRGNIYSATRGLLQVSTTAEVLNSNFKFSRTRPISFFSNTEEVLASKLAPILQSCSESSDGYLLKQGQQVHAQIILNGIKGLLGTRILGMYILSAKFMDAKRMFYQLDLSYASPWNWMIRGFSMMGSFDFALGVYFKMLSYGTLPDKYSFPYVIKACGGLHSVKLGKLIHEKIKLMGFELDVYVCSSLIKLYAENDHILLMWN